MRTIPRDLFNQANLMENIARLYIALEEKAKEGILVDDTPDKDSFTMSVDEHNNTQEIEYIFLNIEDERKSIFRYINSRERYSIYIEDGYGDDLEIFTESGELSEGFLEYALGEKAAPIIESPLDVVDSNEQQTYPIKH